MIRIGKENRLVVADAGWAETIPDWLLQEVKYERMALGLAGSIKPIEEAGDAEACVYLYTKGLAEPLGYHMAEVYIYLAAKLCKRRGKQLAPFMEDKLKAGLTTDEERELKELKRMLYQKRGGEIKHPVLDMLKVLKEEAKRKPESHVLGRWLR